VSNYRRHEVERTVSIGFGSMEAIRDTIADLSAQVERGEEPELYVKGNGANTPDLALRFTNENDPEWGSEPVVDYDEG
jgi:hypothetical protein